MAGRWSVGLAAAAVMLALGAVPAAAQDFRPDEQRLIEVTAPDRAAASRLALEHDVGYVTGDRTAVVVVVNDDELDQLRSDGFEIGKTIADSNTIAARLAEREAQLRGDKLSSEFAERGIPARGVKRFGQTIVNTPGEVVVMRAYTFT